MSLRAIFCWQDMLMMSRQVLLGNYATAQAQQKNAPIASECCQRPGMSQAACRHDASTHITRTHLAVRSPASSAGGGCSMSTFSVDRDNACPEIRAFASRQKPLGLSRQFPSLAIDNVVLGFAWSLYGCDNADIRGQAVQQATPVRQGDGRETQVLGDGAHVVPPTGETRCPSGTRRCGR